MWISPEDARSDFILAAAALVFGTMVVQFLQSLFFYPSGFIAAWLVPVWIVLTMIVPARFLAGHREQGREAWGLVGDRTGIGDGILLVLPLLAAGYVRGFSGGNVVGALFGRVLSFGDGSPALVSLDIVTVVFRTTVLVAAGIGTMLLFGLLVVRARDGFRGTDMSVLEALRTYGLGAVGIGTLLGLLLSAAGGRTWWVVLFDGAAMAVVILLTDRMVDSGDRTTRATILAPAIVAVVAFVFLLGGGIFSPNLAESLYRGAMAGSVAIVLAVLLETRRAAWAAVPLVAVTVWAPTCATLPISPAVSLGC